MSNFANIIFNWLWNNSDDFQEKVKSFKSPKWTEFDIIRCVSTAHEKGQIVVPWDDAWEERVTNQVQQMDWIVDKDNLTDQVYDAVKDIISDARICL